MRTQATKPKPLDRHRAHPAPRGQPAVTAIDLVLQLQRDAGNAAATLWISRRKAVADDGPITAVGAEGATQWLRRGVRLLKAKRYDEAVAAFRESYRLVPSHRSLLNLAAALLDGARYAEAVEAYERYLDDPEGTRKDEARIALARARKALSSEVFVEAQALYKEGRYEAALEAFEKVYALYPHADTRFNQAVCLHRLDRVESAAERYEQYLAEAPAASNASTVQATIAKLQTGPITLGDEVGGAEWLKRGVRLLKANAYDDAVNAFQEGFRTSPAPRFILNEAAALLDGGRYAEAILAYERYLSDPAAPRAAEARAAMERARKKMGGRVASVTNIEASYRWFDQGTAHYRAERYQKALQAFERSYDLYPRALARYNQAIALDKLGRRQHAATRYEMYLDEAPNATDAKKVRDHVAKLRAQSTEVARSAFDRGQEAYQQGRWKEAAAAFLEAFEESGMPEFLYNRGTALDKADDKTAAIRAYAWYLQLAPKAPDAEKVRARIRVLQQQTGNELMVP